MVWIFIFQIGSALPIQEMTSCSVNILAQKYSLHIFSTRLTFISPSLTSLCYNHRLPLSLSPFPSLSTSPRLSESIPCHRILGSLKRLQIRALLEILPFPRYMHLESMSREVCCKMDIAFLCIQYTHIFNGDSLKVVCNEKKGRGSGVIPALG